MKNALRMILGATAFAVALVASSWLLKGSPAKEWVDSVLYIGFACFLLASIVFAVLAKK